MTEKRARALHRAMWRWLAKHPGAGKSEWLGWLLREKDKDVKSVWNKFKCFACLIANDFCYDCPISIRVGICPHSHSLYDKWTSMMYDKSFTNVKWAYVCNRMADAWREIPEGR